MSESKDKRGKGRPKLNRSTRIHLTDNELEIVKDLRRFETEAKAAGLEASSIKHAWFKTKESSLFAKNPGFDAGGIISKKKIEETIDRIVSKHSPIQFPKKSYKARTIETKRLLNVTISDAHIGMDPNPDGSGLFQYEYNREIFEDNMSKVVGSIKKEYAVYGIFDQLDITDLGDAADGWSGQTTRGGHDLDQNMNNAEMFEACVDSKVKMVRELVEAKVANKIVLRCVSNDNHAGDFALIINIAIQKVINLMFKKEIVEVDVLTRFMDHRVYGDHCFILTHGKDKKSMNRGLPLCLTDRVVRFIEDYICHYGIDSKYIDVHKGDLHQVGYEKTKKFDYRNFMSFAPPSNWVQHNFGDSYSGYSIQVIPKNINEISHTDYILDYKKINTKP